jgi:multidrug efflux pump subunit AcrB
VTIIASMLLSVVMALILTPVLCASFLKPIPAGHEPSDNAIFFLRPFFRWFDRVFAQADAPYRMLPQDLEKLHVRNNVGKMVPFSSFASCRWALGSPKLERYKAFPSINIWGEPTPDHSTGEAMATMEEIVTKLPQGMDLTGLDCPARNGWRPPRSTDRAGFRGRQDIPDPCR